MATTPAMVTSPIPNPLLRRLTPGMMRMLTTIMATGTRRITMSPRTTPLPSPTPTRPSMPVMATRTMQRTITM